MKKKLSSHPRRTAPKGRKRGIALITVLLVLSLMVILVLAILSTSMNATTAATRGSNSVRVKDLANTVTSLAIAQIRAATNSAPPSEDGEDAPPFTWISQPGMIRTYDIDGFRAAYPLYSTSTGDITSTDGFLRERTKISSWNNSPERFVDLNAPAVQYDSKGNEARRLFPILDPRAQTIDNVEGFDIRTSIAPGTGVVSDIQSGKVLPMPVEWLYMLRDGSLGTVSSAGTFSGSATATKRNPIVARVAYWVDDESAKINVNTASEGVYWDIPRVATQSSRDFGLYQPASNEASRFPGHPSTTCLSTVFYPNHYPDAKFEDEQILTQSQIESIYELAPKINWGGTMAGTTEADPNTPVSFDQDRLYASVDELVFRMASSGGTRMKNSLFGGVASIPVEKIERARGLLTSHSRSPELNVFGRPRMALWPLHQNETARGNQYRSAFDNAIAFAATLGTRSRGNVNNQMKFFLQRENSQSRTWEFYRHGSGNNRRLYQYIMDQTHQRVPGYGKSLAQKYGASDSATFDYRRASRAARANDLESDAFRDHAKIGAMIFDYLRGTNLYDANVREPYADLDPDGDNFTPFGQTTCFILHDTNLLNGDGGNDDTTWPDFKPKPKGMGRLYTLSEVALVIFCSADGRLTRAGVPGAGRLPWQNAQSPPRFSGLRGNSADRRELQQHPMAFQANMQGQTLRYLQVGVVFELFAPMQGFHQIHPLTTLRMVTGGEGYKGAFGLYDGIDASPTDDNVDDRRGYTKHPGYKIVSQSGFENPLTYWGSQQGNVPARSNPEYNSGNPIGPVLQTIRVGETNINRIKGDLPRSWFGWGGYGGYRILRFADINIRPGREVHQDGGQELTNGSNTLGGIYAQKGIVVNTPRSTNNGDPTMRFQAAKDSKGNLVPMQFLIYDADSGNLSNGNVIQTYEIAFPDGVFPVPQLAHSSSWEGWGRRFGRAGRDEQADGRVDVITRNDVVRSMIPVHGDYRHVAGKRFVPQTVWAPHPYYSDSSEIKAHSLTWSNPAGAEPIRSTSFRTELGALGCALLDDVNAKRGGDTRSLINDSSANTKYKTARNKARRFRADFTFDPEDKETFAPGIDHDNCYIVFDPDMTRDFDNGVGSSRDGAFTNKADDGADTQDPRVRYPYFEVTSADRFDYRDRTSLDNTYSPNQMIPSPVVFGSLPSLVDANIPWNTLMFRPNLLPLNGQHPETGDRILRFGARGVGVEINYEVEAVSVLDNPASRRNEGRDRHQGIINTKTRSVEDEQLPPEHLWLDLFWMPTVQPYPLSEPFSTAGKVNLNYQMMPFDYIERATALHALFKSERMLAIPTEMVDTYKDGSDDDRQVTFYDDDADPWYKKIDADNTLLQFREKFDRGEAFITESEICEMFLYPKTKEPTAYDKEGEAIREFWDKHKLTGDNTLERPYGNLYPRLTTKSNVYTVHMTVQVLKKARSSDANKWEDDKDQVVATYRGSATIERYIDPNRSLGRGPGAIPLYINARNTRDSKDSIQTGLEKFYEYRIVNQKQFAH